MVIRLPYVVIDKKLFFFRTITDQNMLENTPNLRTSRKFAGLNQKLFLNHYHSKDSRNVLKRIFVIFYG
jgi:hypothetical protein